MLPVLFRVPDWIPLLGGEAVTSFGAMLLLAFVVAGGLFERRLREHAPEVPGWELVVTAAVAGLVGAKLLHLAAHAVLGLPSAGLGRGGLDWFGGLVFGAAAVLWQARRSGLPLDRVAGAAAAPLALGYALGRIGSFLVGADYGLPTALPWGVTFPAGAPPTTPDNLMTRFGASVPQGTRAGDFVRVHPTQLYEAGLSTAVFFILERSRRRGSGAKGEGWRLFGIYLALAGAARGAVELLRAKADRVVGPLTIDLLLAVAAVMAGALLWSGAQRRVQRNEVA